jgi:hypothetical protein
MAGVRPSFGVSHSRILRETPWRQLAKLGEARRVLRVAARLRRSFRERKSSTARAPTRSSGGEDFVEEGGELGGLLLHEAALGEDGEEHVLAALGGVGVFAEQAEHEGDGGAEGGASGFGIAVPVAVATGQEAIWARVWPTA